jgi:putative spermidine/putrescine transport system ATP-binding protein
MSLEVCQINKSYAGTRALSPVTHRFKPGCVTAILGPSGSGKSTLLSIISGLCRPDSGKVSWDGKDLTTVAPERRDFGMVFQHYALFPNLSVLKNAEFGLRVRGVRGRQRKRQAMDALERVKIAHLASRRIGQLSGGEQQRVALARAIAIRPRCLLLDEPLSALDAQLRCELRRELQELLIDLGITTLFVTHDQSEALVLGEELIVMNNGRIEQSGTPMEVYAKPKTPFVAGFIGSANLIDALRVENGENTYVELPFCRLPVPLNGKRGPCLAMIRAEDLEVATDKTSHFNAQVVSSSFFGNQVRLHLQAGQHRLILDGPNELLNEMPRSVPVRIKTGKLSLIENGGRA